AAQALKGLVAEADVSGVELPEGRYYVRDLIGLAVVDDAAGRPVGTVEDVLQRPAHDVYAVRDTEGRERLIPAVDEFIKSIDMDARVMRVTLIEGL
ncbi:MAG: ribosome maturation factor RimM, partial [Oscillospiraceae bacterium]|nr:ribosome maturation factor RimM [Oscillospiraceae bacterium]